MSLRSEKEYSKMIRLIEILEKDFEELTVGERQVIRNRASERYGINQKLTEDQLLNAYLRFKLIHISPLEMLTFKPYPLRADFGPFGGVKERFPAVTVTTFSGLNGDKTGTFIVKEETILPIVTVFYETEHVEVVCVAPDGNFCRISNLDFDFDA